MNRNARTVITLIILPLCYLLAPSDARAMHITEGILPMGWALWWFVVAVPFVGYGLFRLKKASTVDISFKPLVGLMAAVVFIISCMPVPVPTAGTCSHPAGTGLSAILLGPAISVVVASVALLIQALFLAHGGLSTLGANIVSMGVMGSFAAYLTFRVLRGFKVNLAVSAFAAGLLADWATYLATSVELASGIGGGSPFMPLFWKILIAFIPTQLPLGILEGAMTAGMVVFLYKRRADLLVKMGVVAKTDGDASTPGKGKVPAGALIALSLMLCGAPFDAATAADKWPGVDETVVERLAEEHGRVAREPLVNTDQGDLLLFVFLLAGTAGGFTAGYYWRSLMRQSRGKTAPHGKNVDDGTEGARRKPPTPFQTIIALAVSSLLFAVPALAAHPLTSDDTGTQGTGKWQFELDSQYGHRHEHGVKENDTEILPILTYGLTDRADLVVGNPYHILRDRTEGPTTRERGFTDTSIEVKWRFYGKEGLSFAVKPGLTLPTGDADRSLGTGKVTYKVFFLATKELEPWVFHLNLGYLRNENVQDARTDIWHASLASEYRLSKRLRAVANAGIERSDDPASGSNPAFLLGGLIYSLSDRIEVDGGYKYGLTRSETGSTILFGLTVRF